MPLMCQSMGGPQTTKIKVAHGGHTRHETRRTRPSQAFLKSLVTQKLRGYVLSPLEQKATSIGGATC